MKIIVPMLGIQRNGGNRILFALINELATGGGDVEILTPGKVGSAGFPLHENVRISPLRFCFGPKALRWLLFLALSPWRLSGNKVLANHFLTAVAARLANMLSGRTNIVYFVQGLEYDCYPQPIAFVAKLLSLFTFRLQNLLPANAFLESELRRLGFSPMKATGIGIDNAFIDTPLPNAATKSADVIIFVRAGKHKRIDLSYEVCGLLSQTGLSLIAVSPTKGLIEPIENQLMEMVVDPTDDMIISSLDKARCMILTSQHEGFALPPLEAMARGLPVVMFPCGGPSVYAEHGHNAIFAQAGRADEIAKAVSLLLNDPERYSILSANARETAMEYGLTAAAKEAALVVLKRFTAK